MTTAPWISGGLNITNGYDDKVNVSSLNGNWSHVVNSVPIGTKITMCRSCDIFNVYVDEEHIVSLEVPIVDWRLNAFVTTIIGTSVIDGLHDVRLNGVALTGWAPHPSIVETLIGCEASAQGSITSDLSIKKLTDYKCESGEMLYKYTTSSLALGPAVNVFELGLTSMYGTFDIYIQNVGITPAVVAVYVSKYSEPRLHEAVNYNVILLPGKTLTRRAFPIVKGESVFLSTTRNNVRAVLSSVEESGAVLPDD